MTQGDVRPFEAVAAEADLDVYTSAGMRTKLRRAVDEGARMLVADLTATTYLDSSGLAVLVGGLKYARQRGCRFGIACSRETLLRVIRVSGLLKIFDVRSSVADFAEEGVADDADEGGQ